MLTFLIMVSYSTLAPFVVIFCAIYFGLYFLIHRYTLTFVHYPGESLSLACHFVALLTIRFLQMSRARASCSRPFLRDVAGL